MKNNLLVLSFLNLLLLVVACRTDPTQAHPTIKKMNQGSVDALNVMTQHICGCLYEYPTQEIIKTATDIITSQKKELEGIEKQYLLDPVLKGMYGIKSCMENTGPTSSQNIVLQKDLEKLLSRQVEKAEKEKLDITISFLQKNCPDNSQLYADFMDVVQMLQSVLEVSKTE